MWYHRVGYCSFIVIILAALLLPNLLFPVPRACG